MMSDGIEFEPSLVDVQCCFCGNGIEKSTVDPIIMKIGPSDFINDASKYRQMMYCHYSCLESTVNESVPTGPEIFED